MAGKLKIQQIKSASGHTQDQHAKLRALGIRSMQHTVELNDTPQIRGMVLKLCFLL